MPDQVVLPQHGSQTWDAYYDYYKQQGYQPHIANELALQMGSSDKPVNQQNVLQRIGATAYAAGIKAPAYTTLATAGGAADALSVQADMLNMRPVRNALLDVGGAFEGWAAPFAPQGNERRRGQPEWFGYVGGSGLTSAGHAVGMTAALLPKTGPAAPWITGQALGHIETAPMYYEGLDKNLTKGQAYGMMEGAAVTTGLLEGMFGPEKRVGGAFAKDALGKYTKKALTKDVIKVGAEEATEEVLQNAAQQAFGMAGDIYPRKVSTLFTGLPENAWGGFAGGGGMTMIQNMIHNHGVDKMMNTNVKVTADKDGRVQMDTTTDDATGGPLVDKTGNISEGVFRFKDVFKHFSDAKAEQEKLAKGEQYSKSMIHKTDKGYDFRTVGGEHSQVTVEGKKDYANAIQRTLDDFVLEVEGRDPVKAKKEYGKNLYNNLEPIQQRRLIDATNDYAKTFGIKADKLSNDPVFKNYLRQTILDDTGVYYKFGRGTGPDMKVNFRGKDMNLSDVVERVRDTWLGGKRGIAPSELEFISALPNVGEEASVSNSRVMAEAFNKSIVDHELSGQYKGFEEQAEAQPIANPKIAMFDAAGVKPTAEQENKHPEFVKRLTKLHHYDVHKEAIESKLREMFPSKATPEQGEAVKPAPKKGKKVKEKRQRKTTAQKAKQNSTKVKKAIQRVKHTLKGTIPKGQAFGKNAVLNQKQFMEVRDRVLKYESVVNSIPVVYSNRATERQKKDIEIYRRSVDKELTTFMSRNLNIIYINLDQIQEMMGAWRRGERQTFFSKENDKYQDIPKSLSEAEIIAFAVEHERVHAATGLDGSIFEENLVTALALERAGWPHIAYQMYRALGLETYTEKPNGSRIWNLEKLPVNPALVDGGLAAAAVVRSNDRHNKASNTYSWIKDMLSNPMNDNVYDTKEKALGDFGELLKAKGITFDSKKREYQFSHNFVDFLNGEINEQDLEDSDFELYEALVTFRNSLSKEEMVIVAGFVKAVQDVNTEPQKLDQNKVTTVTQAKQLIQRYLLKTMENIEEIEEGTRHQVVRDIMEWITDGMHITGLNKRLLRRLGSEHVVSEVLNAVEHAVNTYHKPLKKLKTDSQVVLEDWNATFNAFYHTMESLKSNIDKVVKKMISSVHHSHKVLPFYNQIKRLATGRPVSFDMSKTFGDSMKQYMKYGKKDVAALKPWEMHELEYPFWAKPRPYTTMKMIVNDKDKQPVYFAVTDVSEAPDVFKEVEPEKRIKKKLSKADRDKLRNMRKLYKDMGKDLAGFEKESREDKEQRIKEESGLDVEEELRADYISLGQEIAEMSEEVIPAVTEKVVPKQTLYTVKGFRVPSMKAAPPGVQPVDGEAKLTVRSEFSNLKIISGGQTGADQGGLEAAESLSLETGGHAPFGYVTEEGFDAKLQRYKLIQMPKVKGQRATALAYKKRTAENVRNSDGTALFGNMTSAGSRMTLKAAKTYNKPTIVNPTAEQLREFAAGKKTLNIAGNRESVSPGMQVKVREVIQNALGYKGKEKIAVTTNPRIYTRLRQAAQRSESVDDSVLLFRLTMKHYYNGNIDKEAMFSLMNTISAKKNNLYDVRVPFVNDEVYISTIMAAYQGMGGKYGADYRGLNPGSAPVGSWNYSFDDLEKANEFVEIVNQALESDEYKGRVFQVMQEETEKYFNEQANDIMARTESLFDKGLISKTRYEAIKTAYERRDSIINQENELQRLNQTDIDKAMAENIPEIPVDSYEDMDYQVKNPFRYVAGGPVRSQSESWDVDELPNDPADDQSPTLGMGQFANRIKLLMKGRKFMSIWDSTKWIEQHFADLMKGSDLSKFIKYEKMMPKEDAQKTVSIQKMFERRVRHHHTSVGAIASANISSFVIDWRTKTVGKDGRKYSEEESKDWAKKWMKLASIPLEEVNSDPKNGKNSFTPSNIGFGIPGWDNTIQRKQTMRDYDEYLSLFQGAWSRNDMRAVAKDGRPELMFWNQTPYELQNMLIWMRQMITIQGDARLFNGLLQDVNYAAKMADGYTHRRAIKTKQERETGGTVSGMAEFGSTYESAQEHRTFSEYRSVAQANKLDDSGGIDFLFGEYTKTSLDFLLMKQVRDELGRMPAPKLDPMFPDLPVIIYESDINKMLDDMPSKERKAFLNKYAQVTPEALKLMGVEEQKRAVDFTAKAFMQNMGYKVFNEAPGLARYGYVTNRDGGKSAWSLGKQYPWVHASMYLTLRQLNENKTVDGLMAGLIRFGSIIKRWVMFVPQLYLWNIVAMPTMILMMNPKTRGSAWKFAAKPFLKVTPKRFWAGGAVGAIAGSLLPGVWGLMGSGVGFQLGAAVALKTSKRAARMIKGLDDPYDFLQSYSNEDRADLNEAMMLGLNAGNVEWIMKSMYDTIALKDEKPIERDAIGNLGKWLDMKAGMDHEVFSKYVTRLLLETWKELRRGFMAKGHSEKEAGKLAATMANDFGGTLHGNLYGRSDNFMRLYLFALDFQYTFFRQLSAAFYPLWKKIHGYKTGPVSQLLNVPLHAEKTRAEMEAVWGQNAKLLASAVGLKFLFVNMVQYALSYWDDDEDDQGKALVNFDYFSGKSPNFWNNEAGKELAIKLPWDDEEGNELYMQMVGMREPDQLFEIFFKNARRDRFDPLKTIHNMVPLMGAYWKGKESATWQMLEELHTAANFQGTPLWDDTEGMSMWSGVAKALGKAGLPLHSREDIRLPYGDKPRQMMARAMQMVGFPLKSARYNSRYPWAEQWDMDEAMRKSSNENRELYASLRHLPKAERRRLYNEGKISLETLNNSSKTRGPRRVWHRWNRDSRGFSKYLRNRS